MSIPVLQQVYDETRRLSIAGSGLAAGDFRLKKLVEPLQASAAKAPVFGKVLTRSKRSWKLRRTSRECPAGTWNADDSHSLHPGRHRSHRDHHSDPDGQPGTTDSQYHARVLKPLIEALTTTGAGRMELIKDAHERGRSKTCD